MNNLILQRYKVINTAGQGGYGTVLVAWDTRMRRRVAIKCIELKNTYIDEFGNTINLTDKTQRLNLNNTLGIKKEHKDIYNNNKNLKLDKRKQVDSAGEHWQDNIPGLSEARTAAMIQDANIVTVYDFELEDNYAYIIMEYVEGVTLTQLLDQAGDKLTLDMLTCIFSGISHALEVAHKQNVLHLDIKPDNVLIDNMGKVKVTDFGLATLADEFGYGSADAGTIGYMPPEQMRKSSLDARCDEWALASITYEMFTGFNPFDAKNIPESLNKILDAKLSSPSNFWPDVDDAIDGIIFKALDPNPDKRYLSIIDFSSDLLPKLSSSKAGKRQLASLFKNDDDVFGSSKLYHDKTTKTKKSPFHVFSYNKIVAIVARLFSSLSSILISLIGVINIEFFSCQNASYWLPNTYGVICIVLIAVASAILPSLGLSISLILLSIMLIIYDNILIGIILIVLTCIWFVFIGKRSVSDSNTLSFFPLCDSIGASVISPVLVGLFCRPVYTLATVTFGFFLCLILSGFGSQSMLFWDPLNYMNLETLTSSSGIIQDNIFAQITNAGLWLMLISWILAGFVCSIFMMFKSVFLHTLGPIIAMILLIVGICLNNLFSSNMLHFQPEWYQLLPAVISGVIGIIISIFLPRKDIQFR